MPIRRVDARELRRLFNEGRYWERAIAGEFSQVVLDDRHPSLPAANEPFCTHSQIVSYRDDNNKEVARVHQYLRQDGSLGASRRPDPKKLKEGDVLYWLQSG